MNDPTASNSPTTTEAHNAAAAGHPITTKEPERLIWKPMIADLEKQLSEPALVHEFTPEGSVVNEVRTESDKRIVAEIAHIRAELDKRQNQARDEFNMAHDGQNGEHVNNIKR